VRDINRERERKEAREGMIEMRGLRGGKKKR